MTPAIIIQRAKILLLKADGHSNESVAAELGINTRTVLLWTKKYRNRSDNETPVVYHWTWNLTDVDASETVVTETFSKSVAK